MVNSKPRQGSNARAPAVLRATDLTKTFGSGKTAVRAVDEVSLRVAEGEIVLIMGPSGSGKTTLLSMLGGLLRPTSGRIFIGDTEVSDLPERRLPHVRAHHIGFIFQTFNLLDALTARENVLLPAQLAPGGVAAARSRADELLHRLGLSARADAYPKTLSGGEKQRVAIARALINGAPLLLADEPTGNLDSETGRKVIMVLHDVARDEGCSVVIVTHDPRIEEVADRVLWLEDGRLGKRHSGEHAWVRDPVCGMRVDRNTTRFSATWKGHRYSFCSERCRDRFEAEPRVYVESNGAVDEDAGEPRKLDDRDSGEEGNEEDTEHVAP